jgi:HEAT repeat protein
LARVVVGLGLALALLLVTVGIVAGSVWVENHHPSDDASRALYPRAQGVVTKPIVAALGRQVERYLQGRLRAPYLHAKLSLREALTLFLDERESLAKRRELAFRLAYAGSAECIDALQRVLQTAPSGDRAFMASLIGRAGSPAANRLLWQLLADPDERVVLAAIRGLSLQNTPAASAKLAELLRDPQRALAVHTAAVVGLGAIADEGACKALRTAFAEDPGEELAVPVLNSLGRFPFGRVSDLIGPYIEAAETPPEMRVVAVEALAHSSGDAVPFLLRLAAADADEDVRASAAWAVSAHTAARDLGPALTDLAEREPAADVRRRLYEALLPQPDIPADRLLPLVQAEQDIAARVAGLNAVGRVSHLQPGSATALAFDRDLVPELVEIATGQNSPNLQMRAVFALRRAQTAAAQNALAAIAQSASPQIAAAARNGVHASIR